MKLRASSLLLASVLLVIAFSPSAYARRRGDLPSSSNGIDATGSDCLVGSATPYIAWLDGHSTSCTLPDNSTVNATYPNLTATFAGSGYNIVITPILWTAGNSPDAAKTILAVTVQRPSGSTTTVAINSLALNEILNKPGYVPCNLPSSDNADAGIANGNTIGICMNYRLMAVPPLTVDAPQYDSFSLVVQEPDPILNSDTTMTRWDFVAFTQDHTFFLLVDGVPKNSTLDAIFASFGVDFTGRYNALDLSPAKVNISTTVNGTTAATLGSLVVKSAPTATNDLSSAATPVTAGGYTNYIDATIASPLPGNSGTNQNDPLPTCSDTTTNNGGFVNHSVWYSFTPQASGNVSVSTDGSRYDTLVYVFSGTPAAPNAVACNDDSAVVAGPQSDTGTFPVTTSGSPKYWIMVGEAPTPLGTLLDSNGDAIRDTGSNPVNDILPGSPDPVLKLAVTATGLTPSPASLSFASQAVGTGSLAKSLALKATGANLNSIAPSITGDFALAGGSCASTLSSGTVCTIDVIFTPTATGTRTGTLTVASSGILGPLKVPLTGVGTSAGALSFANASANLGTVYKPNVVTTTQTLTNNTAGSLPITFSISPATGTDFSVGTTGTCGASLAAHASCTVAFKFSPRSTGTQNAAGVVTSGGNTAQIALTAKGILPLTIAPTSLSFGNIFVGNNLALGAKLTNNTASSLSLNAPAFTPGGNDFSLANNTCASSLGAGASCTFQVKFAPTAHRSESGTLSFTSGAYTGSLRLKGTGLYALALSSNAISFGSVPINTGATQTVWLTNNTASSIAITAGIAPTGTAFSISGGTCGANLGAHAACTIGIVFQPTSTGAKSATFTVSGGGYNASASLSGTGQ